MVFPLSEGTFTVDTSKIFVPFNAATDDIKNRPASLLVDIVPFLIKTENELIVLDTGLGKTAENGEFQIHENISRAGFSPDTVTMVLLSHLHKDHAGGICYGRDHAYNLMFPNATYYVQEEEMKFALTKKKSPSYEIEKIEFLSHSPNLKYLNGDGSITENIHYEVSGGHTPFHQVFLIESSNNKYFFGGDVLPQPHQLQLRFAAKYDYDGKRSLAKRLEYGRRAAAEHWTCLFFHAGRMPIANVNVDVNGKFAMIPVQ